MTIYSDVQWYQTLEKDDGYWVEKSKIEFSVELEQLMDRARISKSALARKLGTSPAYVTKVLRGDANLTIESMVKLARALGANYYHHLALEDTSVRWLDVINCPMQKAQNELGVREWVRQTKEEAGANETAAA